MSNNPFLRRVLGEAVEPPLPDDDLAVPSEQEMPQPEETGREPAPPKPVNQEPTVNISAQELAKMWRNGEKMDVATQLMFTPASYVDLVDFCFLAGQAAGRELGQLLDELADTENIPVPEPSDDYSSILQRVAANQDKRTMEPV